MLISISLTSHTCLRKRTQEVSTFQWIKDFLKSAPFRLIKVGCKTACLIRVCSDALFFYRCIEKFSSNFCPRHSVPKYSFCRQLLGKLGFIGFEALHVMVRYQCICMYIIWFAVTTCLYLLVRLDYVLFENMTCFMLCQQGVDFSEIERLLYYRNESCWDFS